MNSKKFLEILDLLETEFPKWKAPVIQLVAKTSAGVFELLMGTVLSARTKDEVTALACKRLFAAAKTPEDILELSVPELEKIIYPVGFYKTKAVRLGEISRILVDEFESQVPDSLEGLLSLPGVGRKTANLVLASGFGIPAICVDIHVHRISNRFKLVATKTPEQTEFALMEKIPRSSWSKINELIVAFGQTICKPTKPRCEICPVECCPSRLCPQTGVFVPVPVS